METTFVEALENSVSLRNSNSEDKQNLKERRFQEEIRQRDLDRDERRHDRELTKQTNLLVAGCVSSMFNGRNTVGNLFDFQRNEEKEMLIQYCPGEGIRRPLPLSIRIKSIAELVRYNSNLIDSKSIDLNFFALLVYPKPDVLAL